VKLYPAEEAERGHIYTNLRFNAREMAYKNSHAFHIYKVAMKQHVFLTAQTRFRTRVTSREIHCGRNGIGVGISRIFLGFPPLIIITPLLHNPFIAPPPEVCDSPDHAAQYHILGLYVVRFTSAPILGWLQKLGMRH
jgi:hypothetical protein